LWMRREVQAVAGFKYRIPVGNDKAFCSLFLHKQDNE